MLCVGKISLKFDPYPAAMPCMMELPVMTYTFKELVPVPDAPNDAVQLEDLTIDRLLKDHFRKAKFTAQFREASFLQQVTLGQILSSPFALYDFLTKCRTIPGCGETAVKRLRSVIELASAGHVNGASEHEDAAVQGGVSCMDGRD